MQKSAKNQAPRAKSEPVFAEDRYDAASDERKPKSEIVMTKECLNDPMTNGGRRRFPRDTGGNSRLPQRLAVPEGLYENSPAFQRREGFPEVSSPEGTVESGPSASLFQPSLGKLWGQAVPTPIGAGAACFRATRRNYFHTSQFPSCCDWPRRHSRAPSESGARALARLNAGRFRDSRSLVRSKRLELKRNKFRAPSGASEGSGAVGDLSIESFIRHLPRRSGPLRRRVRISSFASATRL